ncbi:hypothetical protein ABH926_000990 [Catenulispora sp. GP43]|uniref:mannosyltransferase family protein n=1 Tax=Catenulispora sp. GP43 TaxID=3156263 RepID=UPI0035123277
MLSTQMVTDITQDTQAPVRPEPRSRIPADGRTGAPTRAWAAHGWVARARTVAGPAVIVYTATTALHLLILSVMIRPGGPSLTDRLTAWDGLRFVQIAEHGYPHGMDSLADGSNLAFFPLFPQLIRIVHAASGLSWAVSGILAAHLSLAAALIVMHALLSRLYDRRTATIAIVLLAGAQPMSLVFSMAYSESLFLALTAGALLALHKQAWLSAGVLTALAGLTRPAGAAVVLAMAVAVVLHARKHRHLPGRAVAGLALGCTGVPLFIGWVGLRSGQLNGWFTIQNAGWGTKWDYGRQFLTDLRDTLALSNEFMAVCTAIVTVALIVIAIAAFRRHTWPPLLAYGAGILILTLGQSNYFQCKLRLLILALIFLLPPARSLARTDNRTVAMALIPATLFGCWFGAFMLTTWHYGI